MKVIDPRPAQRMAKLWFSGIRDGEDVTVRGSTLLSNNSKIKRDVELEPRDGKSHPPPSPK